MSVVYSQGQLRQINLGDEQPVTPSRWIGPPSPYGSNMVGLADPAAATYEAIYSSQRWVRAAVDFLADNVAECSFQVFRRQPDDSRVRLRPNQHPYAAVLAAPDPSALPSFTGLRMIQGLVADGAVYGNAYLLKLPDPDQTRQLRLLRLEPAYTWPTRWQDEPDLQLIYTKPGFTSQRLDLSDVLWIRDWAPLGVRGLSVLEPLREMLHEEFQAGVYRSQLWRSGARMSGWISRPMDAPEWSEDAKSRFRQDWQAQYASYGEGAGGTPILQDGMTFQPQVFSAEQAQFLQTRELDREEVAAAFHIPPTMLGQTKGATYANMQQHHEMLYQDTLAPVFSILQSEFQEQLLPEFDANNEGVYCEANFAQKLYGSFQDQAIAAQTAVGRPWMTPNEMRARLNLPRIEDPAADALAVPLNMTVSPSMTPDVLPGDSGEEGDDDVEEPDPWGGDEPGSLALPAPAGRAALPAHVKTAQIDAYRDDLSSKLSRYFRRQGASVQSALAAGQTLPQTWDETRWNSELSDTLLRGTLPISSSAAKDVTDVYGPDDLDWSDDPLIPPLTTNATDAAAGINITTYHQLVDAVVGPDALTAVSDVFTLAMAMRADQIAQTQTTYSTSLGGSQAAHACGLSSKTWITGGANPRPTHAAMDGETVGIDETFSNGMRWPGDQAAGLDESEYAHCTCTVDYSAEEASDGDTSDD